jgi:hypothetical protein
MSPSTQAAVAPVRMPPAVVEFPPEPGVLPRDALGAVEDEDHIVVLGGQGPELMCALLRAGATNVTHLRAHERPEAGAASMLIVPRPPSLDWLAAALPSIRRALSDGGRLAIHTGAPGTGQTQIRRMLTLHGFRAIRATAEGRWLSGDLPSKRFV